MGSHAVGQVVQELIGLELDSLSKEHEKRTWQTLTTHCTEKFPHRRESSEYDFQHKAAQLTDSGNPLSSELFSFSTPRVDWEIKA